MENLAQADETKRHPADVDGFRRIRYMRVDPNNRLVADTLETQWTEKLRFLAQAKDQCETQRQLNSTQISAEQCAKILALASQFPKLWNDPQNWP